jgi:hypothetical protein
VRPSDAGNDANRRCRYRLRRDSGPLRDLYAGRCRRLWHSVQSDLRFQGKSDQAFGAGVELGENPAAAAALDPAVEFVGVAPPLERLLAVSPGVTPPSEKVGRCARSLTDRDGSSRLPGLRKRRLHLPSPVRVGPRGAPRTTAIPHVPRGTPPRSGPSVYGPTGRCNCTFR